jgi:hypothetical protein
MGGQRHTKGKKGGRFTPKGTRSADRSDADVWDELESVLASIVRSVPVGDSEADPLILQLWASGLYSTWRNAQLADADPDELFAGGLIAYATQNRSPKALLTLRALAAVLPEPYRTRAAQAGHELASSGVTEPDWAASLAESQPTEAWLSFDPVDDDGVSVMVGFDGPAGPDSLGLYVDHNLGGMAKDALATPMPIASLVEDLRTASQEAGESVEVRPIPLDEAAGRWRRALELTDMTVEAPVERDYLELRALVEARLASLPGGPPPDVGRSTYEDDDEGFDEYGDLGDDEFDALLTEFLKSGELDDLRAVELPDRLDTIEFLADQVATFATRYTVGTPLRFSPAMAELFCLDWAPHRIAADQEDFELLPDVAAAWIRFVGHRRGIPDASIGEAVEALYHHAPEMLELVGDPATWGPAKLMALSLQERGIDINDSEAVQRFVDQTNLAGGLDALIPPGSAER